MTSEFDTWLKQIGLKDCTDIFRRHAIDFDVVQDLSEDDLRELDLPLGHRKRFLNAAALLNGAQPTRTEPLQPLERNESANPPLTLGTSALEAAALGQERRQVAVLFADLTGYTSLSAELDTEDLQEVMAAFLTVADKAIEQHGGTVDKHLGDGVMAVFGAPTSHVDDTLRAVTAAQAIHDQMAGVSDTLSRDLSCHIGIASGEVLTGAGSTQYTVIGDAVNLASRLSDLAEGGETYLSDEVHHDVMHEVLCDERTNTVIKGLSEPVTVWKTVVHRKKPLKRDLLPFVGRDAERAQFKSIIDAILTRGSGAAFILRGEPGIGKTRLATECLSLAQQIGFKSHHVLVLDFGGTTGSDPLRTILRSLLGIDETADLAARSRAADQLLNEPSFEPDDEAIVQDLLGIPMSEETMAFYRAIENSARNQRKAELLGRVFESRANKQPQIILIEDLHWADQITKDICACLVARCASCSGVLLITSRIEGDPFDHAWRSGTGTTPIYTVDLRPLSPVETIELASGAGIEGAETLSEEIEKAGGNPLFLEMMIRSSADQQLDPLSGGLRSMVQSRVDGLDPTDRRAIQAASIVGQRFDLALLRHLINEPNYNPASLIERSLVQPLGEQYLFAHALVQEGVYASITRSTARAMHRQAAEWFGNQELILRAEHLAKAEHDAAPEAFLNAAHEQSELMRFETAARLLQKGLQLATAASDIYQLNKLLGDVSIRRNDPDTANEAYKRAVSHCTCEEQRAFLYLGIAASNRDRAGDALSEAVDYIDRAQEANDSIKSVQVSVETHALRSLIAYSLGNLSESYDVGRKAVELAEQTQRPELLLAALESFSAANYQLGRFITVLDLTRRLIELAEETENIRFRIIGSYQRTIGHHYNCDFRKAISSVELAIASGEKYGSVRQSCLANEYIARTYLCLGNTSAARKHATQSLEIAASGGMVLREALALIKLAEVSIYEGDLKQARKSAKQAVGLSDGPYILPWSLATLALTQDDYKETCALFSQAEKIMAEKESSSHNHFHLRTAQVEAALVNRDWCAIDRAADRLEAYTASEPLPWTDFHIKRARAISAWGRGTESDCAQSRLADLYRIRNDTGIKAWLPGD